MDDIMTWVLHHGDCRDVLATLPDCSVDSVVTDPPYELGFMGKAWDASGIAYSVDLWREVLRVLKPGGHLAAFGGTRTYHRMAVAIEDAGFEIRDSLHWVYGSGFPKSLDVSKAIDKAAGAEREVLGSIDVGPDMRGGNYEKANGRMVADITAPATDAAKQWQGWGTALKPAHEPIVLARKPLVGTVAVNVLEWGTGALNIDGARVPGGERPVMVRTATVVAANAMSGASTGATSNGDTTTSGRWPANVIFDTEAGAVLDEQSGERPSPKNSPIRKASSAGSKSNSMSGPESRPYGQVVHTYADTGGASRFFTSIDWDPEIDVPFQYVPKPSRRERNAGLDELPEQPWRGNYGDGIQDNRPHTREGYTYEATTKNHHPTVKPLALMRWLVKLITPPGGTVLEPFAGSGTTLMAAVMEGFDVIGIEMTDEYLPIIRGRVAWAENQPQPEPQPTQEELPWMTS